MIKYLLEKEREYQHLKADDNKKAIVKKLSIYGIRDVVTFSKIIGGGENVHSINLDQLKLISPKLKGYERLYEMPDKNLKALAEVYGRKLNTSSKQILEELTELRETEKILVHNHEINFPSITDREMMFNF